MIQNPNQAPQRRGAQIAFGAPSGPVTLVSAGANTTGLIVRTAILYSASNVGIELETGSHPVFIALNGVFNYVGPGVLVPPGQALSIDVTGAGPSYVVTWDVI